MTPTASDSHSTQYRSTPPQPASADPSPLQRAYADTGFLADVAERATRYLVSIEDRAVAPSGAAIDAISALDVPLQDEAIEPFRVLAELDALVAPTTMAIAGPRFFGFVNGASLPAALGANWLTTAWDAHGGLHVLAPGAIRVERIALRWALQLLALDPDCHGTFVTGTSMAHVTALAAARSALLRDVGWDVDADGLRDAPGITVIASEEAHISLFKALGVIGLGRARALRVPVDDQGRLRPDAMPVPGGPTILCLQAGNVNSGASDPMRDAITRARGWGVPLWTHVDGAFGLWSRASHIHRAQGDGAELADSWATDAHKWLNCPYDCGLVIVRDGEALRGAMGLTAAYLPNDDVNPAEYTPEMSRRPRGVDVWAALRSLGRRGVEALVDRNCRQARRLADAMRAAGHAVLNDVVLNQVLVSFGSSDETARVIREVQRDGTCWCGGTVWQGHVAMRVSVVSWNTTDADIDRSIDAILRIARGGSACHAETTPHSEARPA